jgi:hypothetical protein
MVSDQGILPLLVMKRAKRIVCSYRFFSAEPLPLTDLCRYVIRQEIHKHDNDVEQSVAAMALPSGVKDFLLFRDRR